MAVPKGKVAWRINQAYAAGQALALGQDVGHRIDLIILSEENPVVRDEKYVADAVDSGLRPAVMVLDPKFLNAVKWPPGIPVYVVPPHDDSKLEPLERKVERILGDKNLYLLWIGGPEDRVGPIGFKKS